MNEFVIDMSAVHKSYRKIEALRGLDLKVPSGSIYGLLGRNGAGKTTAIKLLMGMLKPDHGEARVFGARADDPVEGVEIRRRIGFVAEEKELYPYMTVEQMIRFTRPFFPKWRDDLERRYLEAFELPPKRKISKLSKGMRSKLMLLLSISRGADLLLLDEPMDGLDPAANEDALREIVELSATEGTTVLFSSHQIADVERISDHVAIIDHGLALIAGQLDELKNRHRLIQIAFPEGVPSSLAWTEGAVRVGQEGRMVSIIARDNAEAILAQGRSFPGASVEAFPMTLKELFLGYLGLPGVT